MDIDNTILNPSIYITFFINKLIPAILIFLIGWFIAGKLTNMIRQTMIKAHIDESIISFSYSVLKVAFRGIVILIVITCFGINISSIIAALGAALVTVGLALKDNLSNAASGAIIIINKPFKIGDQLKTNDICGKVTKIEMLFTTLITPDNREIVIPNSKLTSNYIINATSNSNRRLDLLLPIKNSVKLSEIKPILENIIKNNEGILPEPGANILIDTFKEGYIIVSLQVWCKIKDYQSLKDTLLSDIKNELDKNNIDF